MSDQLFFKPEIIIPYDTGDDLSKDAKMNMLAGLYRPLKIFITYDKHDIKKWVVPFVLTDIPISIVEEYYTHKLQQEDYATSYEDGDHLLALIQALVDAESMGYMFFFVVNMTKAKWMVVFTRDLPENIKDWKGHPLIQCKQRFYKAPENACNSCQKESKTLLRCSKCKTAKYCSEKCQKYDWKRRHKAICSKFILVLE